MTETLLDYVLRNLDQSKGRLRAISTELRIPYTTIRNIYKGVTPNPGVKQIQDLADYFKRKT